MTNQIAEEYYQIGNFVDVITLGQSEAAHKYTTIDGWKGFRFCCPICGDRDRGKKATIFPRMTRSDTGSNYLRWHYLCKGHPTCEASGLHSLEYAVRKYFPTYSWFVE